jgi:hypothetical protein
VCLLEVFKEELSSFFDTTFDLGLSLGGGQEMAAFSALIEVDAVDIDGVCRILGVRFDIV